MQLKTTYTQILAIAAPLMLGSAGQNIVALTDSVFLFKKSESDFAAIGFVGVFYLVIAAIGYGFSKGGQIMIARRMGEQKPEEVGRNFYAMLYFELGLATLMFLFMQYGCPHFLSWFVKSPSVYQKSLEFLHYRSYGVFFSYGGLAMISLYTGVARTKFIMFDTSMLGILNIVLCYGFVFGKLGLPDMGIAGAGLASTIAEGVAFAAFVVYMFFDKINERYHLFQPRPIDLDLIKRQMKISIPSVAQPVIGLGSWFVFFSFIEKNLGEHELAITNLVRIIYLGLSIPSWGFASSINTLVSNVIGQEQYTQVLPTIWKTAKLCLSVTLFISIPILLFPHFFLAPLLTNTKEASLLIEAEPILKILLLILIVFSVGGIYFNALASAGASLFGLSLQFVCVIFYLIFIYIVLTQLKLGLNWAWSAEFFYWVIMLVATVRYLQSDRWRHLKV